MAMRTGYADLPLHGGKAPRWLFTRMVRLSQEIVVLMADEFGTSEVLRRLSDPHWFQASVVSSVSIGIPAVSPPRPVGP